MGAAVALGQPGSVYRYVRTFGETEIPYTYTTTHLNRPNALAVDSANNVYIGESEGHRVLKFNSAGVLQAEIGYTGWYWQTSDEPSSGINAPEGLAVASDGNVWIAEGVHRVSVFTYTTAVFTYIRQLGDTIRTTLAS